MGGVLAALRAVRLFQEVLELAAEDFVLDRGGERATLTADRGQRRALVIARLGRAGVGDVVDEAGIGRNQQGWKIYNLHGSLFFASTANFQELFTPAEEPDEVIIDFRHAKVMNHSAVEAIDALAERYRKVDKRLHLRHLSPDCLEVLTNAKDMVELDLAEDPHYHIADNKLG